MKKLKISILVILSCLFITACGCSKTEYTVTFNSNGGSTVSSQTISKGESATRPASPVREGFEFVGWFLDLEDETSYDFTKKINKNITLIAKWSKEEDVPVVEPDTDNTCTLTCEEGYELKTNELGECTCELIEQVVETPQTSTTPSTQSKPTTVYPTGVSLDMTTISLNTGGSIKVNYTVTPNNATNKSVTFVSNNLGVATVDGNGNIYAVASGTAIITVTTSNGISASATVIVSDVYSYTTEQDGELNTLQHRVYIYKNGVRDNSFQAVYTADGSFIGEYSSESGAIVVGTSQLSNIGGVKVNGILYPLTKR